MSDRLGRTPALSVLICYHNEGPLIGRALKSLFDSVDACDNGRADVEVIVYDNASSQPPDPFISPDYPVRLIRDRDNNGPSYARNRMGEVARGEFLHFHDPDDVFSQRFLPELRKSIGDLRPDLVLNQIRIIELGDRMIYYPVPVDYSPVSTTLLDLVVASPLWLQSGTVRRRTFFEAGGFDEDLWYNEDSELFERIADKVTDWRVVSEPLVDVIRRPNSHSRRDDLRRLRHTLRAYEKADNWLPSKYDRTLAARASGLAINFHHQNDQPSYARALALVQRRGGLTLDGFNPIYRRVAMRFGIPAAERLAMIKRFSRAIFRPSVLKQPSEVQGNAPEPSIDPCS